MKVTIESTAEIVELHGDGIYAPARLWRGATESGLPVICLITRIGVPDGLPAEVNAAFEAELRCEPAMRLVSNLKMLI